MIIDYVPLIMIISDRNTVTAISAHISKKIKGAGLPTYFHTIKQPHLFISHLFLLPLSYFPHHFSNTKKSYNFVVYCIGSKLFKNCREMENLPAAPDSEFSPLAAFFFLLDLQPNKKKLNRKKTQGETKRL